ncbi:MAG: FUSC family protein [Arcicella sp.]|nr:FUSC family protein [Arcicella sp.]
MNPQKPISELTDEELLQETKKRKNDSLLHAFGIGFLGGVAFFSLIRNGLGFLFFLLVGVVVYLISQKKPSYKEAKEEVKKRGLS